MLMSSPLILKEKIELSIQATAADKWVPRLIVVICFIGPQKVEGKKLIIKLYI